ncbi:MAG: methylenetetrahydrofolate reductase [NAD(P)H] [Pseudomonadota bacterium]
MPQLASLGAPRRTLSFEFFPPKSPEASAQLWRSVERLAPLAPDFVSVTYGAGGTTRDRTKRAIRTIRERARLQVAGHLTCVGATREETMAVARDYAAAGVRKIVALRGDPPKGATGFTPHPGGFASSAELVEALVDDGFDVAVSAYPEPHPEARAPGDDIAALKAKIAAGARTAITQFFFDVDLFLRLRDRVAAEGLSISLHPGIMPVEDFGKLCRFAAGCGATIPQWMHDAYSNARTEEEAALLSTAIATEQCDRLMSEGVEHLHFYTLNKPDLTYDICRAIGFQPAQLSDATGRGAA